MKRYQVVAASLVKIAHIPVVTAPLVCSRQPVAAFDSAGTEAARQAGTPSFAVPGSDGAASRLGGAGCIAGR
jgi:hypothetical protein